MIWGGELVLRDGIAVGQLTSGAWGEAVGGCVGLAYIRDPAGDVLTPDIVRSGEYQVNVGGRLYPATVHLRPPFDPAGDRVKGRYQNMLVRGHLWLKGQVNRRRRAMPRCLASLSASFRSRIRKSGLSWRILVSWRVFRDWDPHRFPRSAKLPRPFPAGRIRPRPGLISHACTTAPWNKNAKISQQDPNGPW